MAKKEKGGIIRSSRKGYIVYYFMIVVVIAVIVYIKIKDLPLNKNLLIAAIVFIVLVIKGTEFHRLFHHYELTPHAFEKVEGIIILQRIKRINYSSISQMHLTQGPWEKLLNIGTIELAQFSETVRTEIKNINKPKELLHEISKMIKRDG